MDEISVPLAVEVDPDHNLNDLLAARVARDPDGPLMQRKETEDGPWVEISARDFEADRKSVV